MLIVVLASQGCCKHETRYSMDLSGVPSPAFVILPMEAAGRPRPVKNAAHTDEYQINSHSCLSSLRSQKMVCFLAGFRSQAMELAPRQDRNDLPAWEEEMPSLALSCSLCLRFWSSESSLAIFNSWHWVPTVCQVLFQNHVLSSSL